MHRYGAAPVMVQGKMSSQGRNMRRTEMVHAPMVQEARVAMAKINKCRGMMPKVVPKNSVAKKDQ